MSQTPDTLAHLLALVPATPTAAPSGQRGSRDARAIWSRLSLLSFHFNDRTTESPASSGQLPGLLDQRCADDAIGRAPLIEERLARIGDQRSERQCLKLHETDMGQQPHNVRFQGANGLAI